MRVALGIDPGGSSGAMAVLSVETGQLIALDSFRVKWWGKQANVIRALAEHSEISVVAIEEVQAMGAGKNGRRQGLSSAFSFGCHFGWVHGIVAGIGIPDERVLCPRPQEWQKQMGCLTGGDKQVSLRFARSLFPTESISEKKADAILLAEYSRLVFLQRGSGRSFQSILDERIPLG